MGSRIARSRQYHSINNVMTMVNLTPGTLGQISPISPVVLLKSPHGTPGRDVCPFLDDTVGGNAHSSPRPLSDGGLPGYTGWYRPHSPVLNWYRPIHFGSRPLLLGERTDAAAKYVVPQSIDGKLQYHGTRKLRHQLVVLPFFLGQLLCYVHSYKVKEMERKFLAYAVNFMHVLMVPPSLLAE